MFSKVFVASLFAALAVANPPPASECSTGPVQCCNQVQSASNPLASALLGLLGIIVGGANVPIGIACTSIPIVGVGSGATCCYSNSQAVCCENNSFNGIVAVGCTPVDISL